MKYYLCGPIDTAGQKEKNIETFKRSASYLRTTYCIVSPIEENTTESCDSYEEFIREDMKLLLECNAIILLPGWPQSRGARGELEIAMKLNMEVYFFDIDRMEKLINMNF